jgi:hypothetical protein
MKAALAKRPPRTTTTKWDGTLSRATSDPQAPLSNNEQLAARPSAAEIRNALLAKACLAPKAIPGIAWGVSWLIYRDGTTGLLALRAINAEELRRGPFPRIRGRA